MKLVDATKGVAALVDRYAALAASHEKLVKALNEAVGFVAAWQGYYAALHEMLPDGHPIHAEVLKKCQEALAEAEKLTK